MIPNIWTLFSILVILGVSHATTLVKLTSSKSPDPQKFTAHILKNSPRIVNGEEAVPGEFPWQVSLEFGATNINICSGALVDPTTIVTTATCTTAGLPNHYRVVAGEHDFTADDNDGTEQIRPALSFTIMNNFDESKHQNDLAIIKVAPPFEFNDKVHAIPLAEPGMQINETCVVSGWGQVESGNPGVYPAKLQKGQVDLIPREECQDLYWSMGVITEGMVCASKYFDHRNACIGDGGGPLVCSQVTGGQVLTGLVSGDWVPSSDTPCGHDFFPVIYTKIAHYKSWIDANMK